jgi:hypothetical protein
MSILRHSRESGSPGGPGAVPTQVWIPAFAGMTGSAGRTA